MSKSAVNNLEEEQKGGAFSADQILPFHACLKILEEADNEDCQGYDFASGARSGDENDYDDELNEDEDNFYNDNYHSVISESINAYDSKKVNNSTVLDIAPFKKGAKLKF